MGMVFTKATEVKLDHWGCQSGSTCPEVSQVKWSSSQCHSAQHATLSSSLFYPFPCLGL